MLKAESSLERKLSLCLRNNQCLQSRHTSFFWLEWSDTLLSHWSQIVRVAELHIGASIIFLSFPQFSAESCRNGSIIICSKISVSSGLKLLWVGIWLVYGAHHPKITVSWVSCIPKEGEWWVYGSIMSRSRRTFCPERRRKWQQQCGSQPTARFLLSSFPPLCAWPDSLAVCVLSVYCLCAVECWVRVWCGVVLVKDHLHRQHSDLK